MEKITELKEVIGYEGQYKIHIDGYVLSADQFVIRGTLGKKVLLKGRRLKLQTSTQGYYYVHLFKDGKSKNIMIHRLIAIHFIPNPENHSIINHKNGIKTDNSVENLEWCDQKHNLNHAFKTGLNKYVQKNDRHRSKAVFQLDSNKLIIKEFPSTMEVQRTLGFKSPNINKAIKTKTLSNGYYWQYKVI
jgi:hypothetical protein